MHRWGIKTKVVLLSMAPTLGIALVLASVFIYNRINDLNEQLLRDGTATAEYLASTAQYGVLSGNANQLIALSGVVQEQDDITTATIYGYKGQILAHSGPKISEPHTIPASFTDKPTRYRSEKVLRFSAPIKLNELSIIEDSSRLTGATSFSIGKTIGWAIIEVSQQAIQQKIANTIVFAVISVSLTTALCIILALNLNSTLTKPLSVYSEALSEIKEGKLDTRVYVKTSSEFSALQDGINALAESLAKARTEMQENIDQATQDLRETLETIEIQNIELDIARKEALEASNVKSEFLANMSHEIRTPLNGIIGFTKLLSKSNLSIQQRDQLNTILKSSEILLTIINDILDFSKIEAGKLILDSVSLNLREIVEDVLTMLAPGAHEKNLDLAGLIYSDVPALITGDPLRLKQVITNLVSNGIKFSQNGEVVVRVMLEGETEDESLIKITVTDTGVGLSRVQQQSLFSPFSQADASTARRFGGTGLGLVISRRLTEQMGGQIGAESELGRGSVFWILLPVKTDSEGHGTTTEIVPPIGEERIIYLENQPKTRLVISHTLHKWGAKVDLVDDINQLVDQVFIAQQKNKGYSVAIIGITNSQLNSAALLEAVRRLEYQLDCRTLILTPTVDVGAEEPLSLSEASNYLIKPPSEKRLANTLTQLIKGNLPEEIEQTKNVVPTKISNLRKPRILAVDDNPANLKLIRAFLEDLGVVIETASSGYEALTKTKLRRYDIIFMDVQMPGMDGIATTIKIREFEVGKKRTPIIALTAHALSEEKEKLLASGFDGYLTKPTNENELQSVIADRTGFLLTPRPEHSNVAEFSSVIKPSIKQALAPCVDINAGIQLAGQKADLAEELFSMLLESLPAEREAIIGSHKNADFEKLLETVHRLHGATRYCGVPSLRKAASDTESRLKRKDSDITEPLQTLLDEIERVIYWVGRNNWQQGFRSYKTSQQLKDL